MVTLKARLPAPIFKDLVSNLNAGDGVEWDEATGDVLPTKTTSSSRIFEYHIRRPMVVDRIFHLQTADLKGLHMKDGNKAWRRGMGCAVLKLSDAPKGRKASVFSMVGGNLVMKFTEPKKYRAWPTITLKFWVLTVDYRGNVLWAERF